jgi:hypothetical protein
MTPGDAAPDGAPPVNAAQGGGLLPRQIIPIGGPHSSRWRMYKLSPPTAALAFGQGDLWVVD